MTRLWSAGSACRMKTWWCRISVHRKYYRVGEHQAMQKMVARAAPVVHDAHAMGAFVVYAVSEKELRPCQEARALEL